MIFNSFVFLFAFLPVVLGLFFLPAMRPHRTALLAAASLIFYAYSGLEHAVVLVVEVVLIYALVYWQSTTTSRLPLVLAVTLPAIVLVYYKYTGFILGSFGLEAGPDGGASKGFSILRNVLLPAGISFFTFEFICFAVDRHRGVIAKMPAFSHFTLYATFFPHLVAGPILRYHEVKEAIAGLKTFRLTREDAAEAIALVCLGLAAKVLLADVLGSYVDPLASRPEALTRTAALYVLFAYSFQIYFDFYGYSLVAIGLGRLFGFRFPDNFRRPYEALNPRDFWRRWHVTLSYWLRDYVYLPIGGNQAYRRNILIVFLACGLWHGAGWNFVAWGAFHAFLVIGYGLARTPWDRLAPLLQRGLTFVLVSLGWVLFLFDFDGALDFGSSLIGLHPGSAEIPSVGALAMLALSAAICFGAGFETMARFGARTARGGLFVSIALAALMTLVLMFIDTSRTFIYFRF